MAKNYSFKLRGSEPAVYTSAVIAYKNLMLSKDVDDSIPSHLLEKVEDTKVKLSELEYKHLLKALQLYRNNLIEKNHDSSTTDSFLSKILCLKQDRER